jgi:hypothetical protein
LLGEVEAYIRSYVALPGDAEAAALTLYVAHTYALEGAHATPYVLVISPEKRSGKTRLLEVVELLAHNPWRVAGASEAAIFRRIAADRPTLLLDEIDAIFSSFSERTEPLRAILNAGNRPGAAVARCVGEKGDQVRDFEVFCPKVLAGIDKGERIPDTIRDRSITIAMRRKVDAEQVRRLRWRHADADAEPLRECLAAWAAEAIERLRDAEPDLPPELDDRSAEAWEPLLAIADEAGAYWPERARNAARALSMAGEAEEQSLGTLLLGAIREAFADDDRLATATLLERINRDEEMPFGGWRDGRGLDARQLAKLLRPYRVKPRTVRLPDGTTPKGYLREQFTDVWARWLDAHPLRTEAPQAPQAPQSAERDTDFPHEQAVVADVADVAAISGGGLGPWRIAAQQPPQLKPRWTNRRQSRSASTRSTT